MPVEENKELVRSYFSADVQQMRQAVEGVSDEYHAPSFIAHTTAGDMDRNAYVRAMHELHHGFPDLKYVIEDILAEGDKAVCVYRFTGTHTGAYFGIPPTGKKADVPGISVLKIRDGKFIEGWFVEDMLGKMQQLGVIPR
jgi:predicted ester cyclase